MPVVVAARLYIRRNPTPKVAFPWCKTEPMGLATPFSDPGTSGIHYTARITPRLAVVKIE